jgi:excisionase family DNA binding protein
MPPSQGVQSVVCAEHLYILANYGNPCRLVSIQEERSVNARLLTIEDAAQRLGRTVQAVYRLVERRKIPFRKDGKRVFFVESELQEFIENLPGLSLDDLREREKAGV